MTLLEKIMAERKEDVARTRRLMPESVLREQARHRTHHSLRAQLEKPGVHIIAETKKASPSAGLLHPDYHPDRIALTYQAAGASAVSVLTEPLHFLGQPEDLIKVRNAVSLPVLRKDFIGDPYQILEAAAWGADVILLIVAALAPQQLAELYEAALQAGLEPLVEVHTREECEQAIQLPRAIIGVNHRNLKTLAIDLSLSEQLAPLISPSHCPVAESGLRSAQEIQAIHQLGYRGFLIGEALLRAGDPAGTLRKLCLRSDRYAVKSDPAGGPSHG